MDIPTPFKPLPELSEAWTEPVAGPRLRGIRHAAEAAREAILESGPVLGVETCDLLTLPYPAGFAFSGLARTPSPYIFFTNRMNVVQFEDWTGTVRTLLFNPTDYERGKRTPFFWNMKERYGELISYKVMSTPRGTVIGHLARLGLSPEDVDYIAYDHHHTQDVRGWLGGTGASAFFPRAKLLVQRREWAFLGDLHPLQRAWYVEDGADGVPEDRVVQLDGDAWLGKGVALVSTPGHTEGNMSLAVATDSGELFVVSENGVSTDSYAPLHSRIPGLKKHAQITGEEVILNGNTRIGTLDQYTAMVLERTLAGPSRANPDFPCFFPSSELTRTVFAPRLGPTFSHGTIKSGTIRAPMAAGAAGRASG
jgi:hypothetical protein